MKENFVISKVIENQKKWPVKEVFRGSPRFQGHFRGFKGVYRGVPGVKGDFRDVSEGLRKYQEHLRMFEEDSKEFRCVSAFLGVFRGTHGDKSFQGISRS